MYTFVEHTPSLDESSVAYIELYDQINELY